MSRDSNALFKTAALAGKVADLFNAEHVTPAQGEAACLFLVGQTMAFMSYQGTKEGHKLDVEETLKRQQEIIEAAYKVTLNLLYAEGEPRT